MNVTSAVNSHAPLSLEKRSLGLKTVSKYYFQGFHPQKYSAVLVLKNKVLVLGLS